MYGSNRSVPKFVLVWNTWHRINKLKRIQPFQDDAIPLSSYKCEQKLDIIKYVPKLLRNYERNTNMNVQ